MMGKHTAGPWEWQQFDGSDFDEELWAVEADFSVIRLDHGYALGASIDKTWPADKALIAAAPDLLAACEAEERADLHPAYCSWCQGHGNDAVRCREWYYLKLKAQGLRQAAIAKAKRE